MNPCTPHSTVNPELHARWLSWLDPDAVKSAAGGRLLDERHVDEKTNQARVLVERYYDAVKQRVRVRKRYVGDYSPVQAREFDRISTLMVKNFFPSSVTLGSQSPTLQLGGQRRESDRGSEARETEIDMAHFGSDLLAWEGLARNARLSPFSHVSSLAALYAALLRKMHQFHRCGLIHCDIKADNICVGTTSASAGGLTAALSGSIELASITPIDFGMTLLRGKQDAFDSRLVSNADYMPRYYLQCMDDCWRLMLSGERDACLHLANDLVSCLSWRVDAFSLAFLMSALTNMAIRFHGANAQQAQLLILVAQKLKAFGSTEPGLAAGADQRRWANQLMSEIKPGATDLPYIALAEELEKLADNLGADHNGQITYDLRDVAVRVQTKHRPLDSNASELPPSESLYVLAGQTNYAPSAVVMDERLWKVAQALAPTQGVKAYADYLDKAPHPAKYEAQAIDQIVQPNTPRDNPVPKPADMPGYISMIVKRKTFAPQEVFTDFEGGPEMVHIPSGEFRMGNEPHARYLLNKANLPAVLIDLAEPSHGVQIKAFGMARYPVTKGEYRSFVENTGHSVDDGMTVWTAQLNRWEKDEKANWQNPGFNQTDLHPVVGINWEDAQAYCRWLSKKTAQIYRLPSEAEWEYACRAGTKSMFWMGDEIKSDQANFDLRDNVYSAAFGGYLEKGTTIVNLHQPNPFGLYDMHGNVWEWCQDGFDDSYQRAPADGTARQGVPDGSRVLRGGAWNCRGNYSRSASRHSNPSNFRSSYVGFRVTRAAR